MCMNGDDGDDVGQFSQFHISLPFASVLVRTYAKVREGVKEPIQYTGTGSTPPPYMSPKGLSFFYALPQYLQDSLKDFS